MRARIGAAIAFAALAAGSITTVTAADAAGPACRDPNLANTEFVCGQLSVELAYGVNVTTVLARSAPTATILYKFGPRAWTLAVPRGTEFAVRDALAADPMVTFVSVIYIGYTSGLPDTATGRGPATSGDAAPDTAGQTDWIEATRKNEGYLIVIMLIVPGAFVGWRRRPR